MTRRRLGLRLLAAPLLATLLASAAFAQATMRMVESFPQANAIMDGHNTRFSVKFDGPVDHNASRLLIEQNGAVVQTLRPRLNSQPNTLYSDGHPLKPGTYMLRWVVRGMHGEDGSGAVAFTVQNQG